MPRNLDRRIELMFPVLSPALRERIVRNLARQLADDVKGHDLDGAARDVPRAVAGRVRSQLELHGGAGAPTTDVGPGDRP